MLAISQERIKGYRLLALALILMVFVTLGLREIAQRPSALPDYPAGISVSEVNFVVNSGDSGAIIASNLEKFGVIKSATTFFRLAVSDVRSARIAPGTYRMDLTIPARQALDQLLDLGRIVGLITLRDGVRLNEVKLILKEEGYEKVDEAFTIMQPPPPFSGKNLEGFLYPAKYSFAPSATSVDVVTAMLRRFNQAVANLDFENIPGGLSTTQIITAASLIEAEGTPDVFRKISRVIYNRIKIRMPLQFDSTVHYFLNQRGDISLSINQTKIANPYNTYLNAGLPPGPIGSPTRAAISAALDPEPGDWIYFITVAPSETRFTKSYEEFLQWKVLYRQNLRKGLFDD
jgi:UPF0755 protein